MEVRKRLDWLVRDKAFYRRLAALALPIAGQNVLSFLVGLGDNAMVGGLGEAELSGVYVVNQIQNVLGMLMIGLGAAVVIIAAQYYGKGDVKSVKTVSMTAMRFAIGAGLIVTAGMALFGRQILGLLTTDQAAIEQGMRYLRWAVWTYMMFCISGVLGATLRCAGIVRITALISSVTAILDLLLNYVMIYGKLGLPAMGVAGASASTVITRALELAALVTYLFRIDRKLQFKLRDLTLRSRRLTRDFFVYGGPVILGDIFWGIGGTAQAAIIGRLGNAVMSASSAALALFQVFAVFVYGASSAGSLIVGQEIGKDHFDLAKKYTRTLQLVYPMIGVASSLLVLLLFRPALLLYPGLEPETLQYIRQFMYVLAVMIIGTSYQMSTLQIVRAGGATHFVLFNDLIFVWLVVIPLSSLMAFHWGGAPWMVFACLKCDQWLKCAVAAVKVNRFRWMKNLTRRSAAA
ncbi:MAG: MATE family efflux transporter [Clostridiales bacterium]|nr:MATE family efflux transporter [Clostridiales bacterium]